MEGARIMLQKTSDQAICQEKGDRTCQENGSYKAKGLKRWLDYVDMSESEFDRIADFFRDPRVWMLNESKEDKTRTRTLTENKSVENI